MFRIVTSRFMAFAFVFCVALGSVVSPSAVATIILPVTVGEMTERASVIVSGVVRVRECKWNTEKRHIHTYVSIEVVETLFGPSQPLDVLTVRTLGGEVGDVGMSVSGEAEFAEGEEVLVFLRDDPAHTGKFLVIGMSQGKYRIEKDAGGKPMAVANTKGLAFAVKQANGGSDLAHGTEGPVSLTALKGQIADALKKKTKNSSRPSGP